MQNLFFIPPHQPQDRHPRPLGVKSVVTRGAPTRLDMSLPHPGLVQFDLCGDVPPMTPKRSPRFGAIRSALGGLLIRIGQAITPHPPSLLGQPG